MSALPQGIVSRGQFYNVDPLQVRVRDGHNPRIDFGDLESLKASIREHGVQRPLLLQRSLKDGVLEVIDGGRRFAAVQALLVEGTEIKSIPAILEDRNASAAAMLITALVANDGKPLLPMEEGLAYQRLVAEGMTAEEIAKSLGRSVAFVVDRMTLVTASPAVKEAVTSGKVGITLAQQVVNANKDDHGAQEELISKAAASKEGKREVQETVNKPKRQRAESSGKQQILNELGIRMVLASVVRERMESDVQGSADEILKLVRADFKNDPEARRSYTDILIGAELALRVLLGESSIQLVD